MHELNIVRKIVDSAEDAAAKTTLGSVTNLRLRLGKMAGINVDQLGFLFNVYEKGPKFKNAKLEVEPIPVELECPECRHLFCDTRFDDYEFAHRISHAPITYEPPPCPKCHANGPEVIRGQELELTGLDGE